MADVFEDTASRIWWAVRRYFWVFAITVPAAVAILLASGPSGFTADYRASALVIGSNPEVPVTTIPKIGEAVFEGGSVAEIAVRDGKLPIAPADLIPGHAELEPAEENIFFNVIGIHSDRRTAADIANAVAKAFADEMTRSGPDIGEFKVQDTARVPEQAEAQIGAPILMVLGGIIGLLVGAGIIGLVLTLRRPVLGAQEAAALIGAPLVGTPTLPAKRGLPPEGANVPGLAAAVKRLFPTTSGTVVLIAPAGAEELRTTFAQLVAGTIGRDVPTFLVASPDRQVKRLYEHVNAGPKVVLTDSLPERSTWARSPIVIDGPSARGSDAPQMIPESARIVLVVKQGASRAKLLEVAGQFLPGEIAGVLFARRGTAWPWLVSPRTAPAPSPAAAPAPHAPVPPRPAEQPAPPGPMYVDHTKKQPAAEPRPAQASPRAQVEAAQRRDPEGSSMPPRSRQQPLVPQHRDEPRLPLEIRLDEPEDLAQTPRANSAAGAEPAASVNERDAASE